MNSYRTLHCEARGSVSGSNTRLGGHMDFAGPVSLFCASAVALLPAQVPPARG